MKKLILAAIIICGFMSRSFAQTNGSFENWTKINNYEDPNGWVTFNVFTALGDSASCLKSTKAYSGKYSALLRTFYSNLFMDTTPAVLLQQTPYTSKPNSLRFAYQYKTPGSDSAMISVEFYEGSTDDPNNVIGSATAMLGKSSNWKYVQEPITWTSLNNPDTAVITVITGFDFGSEVLLDDISLSAFGASLSKLNSNTNKVFFNKTGEFEVSGMENLDATLEIFDNSGKAVYQGVLTKGKAIETSHLSSGVYFYRLSNNGAEYLQSGKVLKR